MYKNVGRYTSYFWLFGMKKRTSFLSAIYHVFSGYLVYCDMSVKEVSLCLISS